ncbi:MAG: HRDC domain-containing protein [Rickettsiaceae bacterium]|nr:HRDC domain-containing protein [Rickettsiaceae bacterium]
MLLIQNDIQLDAVVEDLLNQKVIGIDTEFVRNNTYFAELCLVQISTLNNIYIIDPYLVKIAKLKDILLSRSISKVFHACSQDIKIFYKDLNLKTNNIFDTQESINFLGIKKQISYRDACLKILNKSIEKEQQFRNWNHRPLPFTMLEYAAQDVRYLITMQEKLKTLMEEKKIYINFCNFMESFSSDDFYKIKFDDMWKKVNTKDNSRSHLKKLKILAAVREVWAIELNSPRSKIISDDNLNLIALHLPTNMKELYNSHIILNKFNHNMFTKLFELCSGIKESHNLI